MKKIAAWALLAALLISCAWAQGASFQGEGYAAPEEAARPLPEDTDTPAAEETAVPEPPQDLETAEETQGRDGRPSADCGAASDHRDDPSRFVD